MAYDVKTRAKWVAKLMGPERISLGEAEKQSGIRKQTLVLWLKAARSKLGEPQNPDQPVVNRYISALERLVCASMEMVASQAELLADKDYVRNKSADDIVKHGEFIQRQLKWVLEFEQKRVSGAASGSAALPERSETVVCEIVDE